MAKKFFQDFKPFLSLLILISTLFFVVFIKMEVRRMGYTLLKTSRDYKLMQDRLRLQEIAYAKFTRPERIRSLAVSRLTMGEAKLGQIIQLSGDQIAVEQ